MSTKMELLHVLIDSSNWKLWWDIISPTRMSHVDFEVVFMVLWDFVELFLIRKMICENKNEFWWTIEQIDLIPKGILKKIWRTIIFKSFFETSGAIIIILNSITLILDPVQAFSTFSKAKVPLNKQETKISLFMMRWFSFSLYHIENQNKRFFFCYREEKLWLHHTNVFHSSISYIHWEMWYAVIICCQWILSFPFCLCVFCGYFKQGQKFMNMSWLYISSWTYKTYSSSVFKYSVHLQSSYRRRTTFEMNENFSNRIL